MHLPSPPAVKRTSNCCHQHPEERNPRLRHPSRGAHTARSFQQPPEMWLSTGALLSSCPTAPKPTDGEQPGTGELTRLQEGPYALLYQWQPRTTSTLLHFCFLGLQITYGILRKVRDQCTPIGVATLPFSLSLHYLQEGKVDKLLLHCLYLRKWEDSKPRILHDGQESAVQADAIATKRKRQLWASITESTCSLQGPIPAGKMDF